MEGPTTEVEQERELSWPAVQVEAITSRYGPKALRLTVLLGPSVEKKE